MRETAQMVGTMEALLALAVSLLISTTWAQTSQHQRQSARVLRQGRLLEIYRESQMSFLQEILTELEEQLGINDGFIWYWLGLNDIQEEGQWVWPSGSQTNFTYWWPGEPFPGQ